MSVSESIRTQSKIGCYDLEKVIGKGNFAVVRLATHIPTRMKVSKISCDVRWTLFNVVSPYQRSPSRLSTCLA